MLLNKKILINNNTKIITEQKSENTFLGKKKKINFDVFKNVHKKPLFQTYHINNIPLNNLREDNNINSSESTSSNKEIDKLKPKKVKLFDTFKYFYMDNYPNQKLDRGRWSYDEHIKFIKAFVYLGKNYSLIQRYISSRNVRQIISHAQKFFKRLKQIKNNEYDFSSDKIKNLTDIFNIIEKNNKTNMNNEEYFIHTLITLFPKKSKNDLFVINKNNIDNKIYKNEEINKEDKEDKTYLHLIAQNQNKLYSEEIDINNIIERNIENIEQKKVIISQEQENYFDFNYIDNITINNFNKSNLFLSDLDLIFPGDISSKNDYIYYINRKSPNFNFITDEYNNSF